MGCKDKKNILINKVFHRAKPGNLPLLGCNVVDVTHLEGQVVQLAGNIETGHVGVVAGIILVLDGILVGCPHKRDADGECAIVTELYAQTATQLEPCGDGPRGTGFSRYINTIIVDWAGLDLPVVPVQAGFTEYGEGLAAEEGEVLAQLEGAAPGIAEHMAAGYPDIQRGGRIFEGIR